MKKVMLNVLEKTYTNLELRRRNVPLFMSDPGIGKTTIVHEFVDSINLKNKDVVGFTPIKMLKLTLSQRMPNEVVGMMMPNLNTGKLEVFDSYELTALNDGDVLFIDEVFNGTLKQTLDAFLNLLEDRTLPSGKKMADIMIVAASNPQGLINLTPQIKERFQHIKLLFNGEEYQEYLKEKYGMPLNISANLCTLIRKEKFDSESWNYCTPRSIEKALLKTGYGIETSYDDVLLPFLTMKIKLPNDIIALNYKAEEEIEYLQILKLICQAMNDKLTGNIKVEDKKSKTKKTVKPVLEEVTS